MRSGPTGTDLSRCLPWRHEILLACRWDLTRCRTANSRWRQGQVLVEFELHAWVDGAGDGNRTHVSSRVRRRPHGRPLPSEPDVKFTLHPAQAARKPASSEASRPYHFDQGP